MRIRPADLLALERGAQVAESVRPYVAQAAAEAEDLIDALGGVDDVTPQQRCIVEDLARVGIVLRATLAAYVQQPDPELASKVATLAGARRSSLVALGLSRRAREIDWSQPVEVRFTGEGDDDAHAAAQGDERGDGRDSTPRGDRDRGSERDSGGHDA